MARNSRGTGPRTRIEGGSIIAFDGREHCLLEGGVLEYLGNEIVYVGRHRRGEVDETINASGKLVIPGLISTHAHVSAQEGARLVTDAGRRDFFRSGFLNYLPTHADGGPSFLQSQDARASTSFGMAALLRGGVTTVVAFAPGGEDGGATMTALVGELGLRVYFAPLTTGAEYQFDAAGRLVRRWTERQGLEALERAARYVEAHDGDYEGRVRGIIVVDEFYNATPRLLRGASEIARSLGVGLTMHVAEQLWEFMETVRMEGATPLEVLEREDVLGPEVILAHCLYVSGHSATGYPHGDDLGILARSGATVAHAPLGFARRGVALESFQRYLDRGVNLAMGTDVFPLDLFEEMRTASEVCKLVERNHESAQSLDVFNAATLGGARALGRDDLGRLAPDARADIVILDWRNLRIGPNPDPIRALVHLATSQTVDTVIVDGRTVVSGGNLLTCEAREVVGAVQASSERVWAQFPHYDWGGRTVEEVFPPSLARWQG